MKFSPGFSCYPKGVTRSHFIRIAVVLFLGGAGPAAGAWNPCLWTLDESFVSTLFLRLHSRTLPDTAETYLQATRFSFRENGPHSADFVLSDPAGGNIGYVLINRERLNAVQTIVDLPGYTFEVYVKPKHQPSGLGTMLMLLTAHHLDKRGLKLRAPVNHTPAAEKSFQRFNDGHLLKKVIAQKDEGPLVEVWEFDLSKLSEQNRMDLDAISFPGIENWHPKPAIAP